MKTGKTAAAAQRQCQEEGGYLVNIGSAAENNFVAKLDPQEDLWIGLAVDERYYTINQRVYFWTNTQRRAQYTNWHRGKTSFLWNVS